ncbi:MAG: PqqD family peptide modification chaperone [Anaerolineaceae bacterium]
MDSLKSRLADFFLQPQDNGSNLTGVSHFQKTWPEGSARLHLRIEEDGSGLLFINANQVFHLNQTAARMALLSLQEKSSDQIINDLTRSFRVSRTQAEEDYQAFRSQFDFLISPDAPCPICDLELETVSPFSSRPSAPYRMDLAVTYRCNNNCSHCYNARPRIGIELTTDDWKRVIDRLWEIGIPHIVFTGGEPTLRPDLRDLIAYAQTKGQITGINTNGRRLKDLDYIKSLHDAGLDHIQITLESSRPKIHDLMVEMPGAWEDTVAGLKNALSLKLFVMTNTTLLQTNQDSLADTLTFLGEMGVPTVGLNALIHSGKGAQVESGLSEACLPPLLELAKKTTAQYGQRLIWYTPTQYCHFDPMLLNLGVKGCTAALYNMCVEPDGSVIPCQSYYSSLGNILTDPWSSIWQHPLSTSLRERKNLPLECDTCSLINLCGGGCPLSRQQPAVERLHSSDLIGPESWRQS